MKLRKVLVGALLLLVINCLLLIEGKKILLAGLVGLHALKHLSRLQGLHHVHKLVTYYLPLRYAADAWKSYGKVTAISPHLPNILKAEHNHAKSLKLSAEQSYEVDKWLDHYFPEELLHLDHNYY